MIRDLNNVEQRNHHVNFVIIGGGTVGLIIAKKLVDKNLGKVIVLELGGDKVSSALKNFPEVVFSRSIYEGAELGRFAGLGGTSARWGGAMIPFLLSDFEDEYQTLIAGVSAYATEIEKIFSLSKGPYVDNDSIEVPNYLTRKAKWPRFSKRNVASLYSKELKSNTNLIVYTHANVKGFEELVNDKVSISAENESGNLFVFECDKAIITAGAIESTRMLLEIEEKFRDHHRKSTTGLNFSDHLSVKIAEIKPIDRTKLNLLIGYRFSKGGSMSNIRFELQQNSTLRKLLPPHFIHISFDLTTPGGFGVLREILRELQERKFPSIKLFADLFRHLPWILRAIWWRFFKHRLLYPDEAKLEMHLVFEQHPSSDNRLLLKNKPFSNKKLVEISWGVSQVDRNNLIKILEYFKSSWKESGIFDYAETIFLENDEIIQNLEKGGGIFHPTGSTQIRLSDSLGSVNTDLKIDGFNNLFLVSTSVMKYGGGANPTMTEIMFGLRLVDHLASLHGVPFKD